jgi:hypothetical protein
MKIDNVLHGALHHHLLLHHHLHPPSASPQSIGHMTLRRKRPLSESDATKHARASRLEQQPHHCLVPLPHGQQQRRPTLIILKVHVYRLLEHFTTVSCPFPAANDSGVRPLLSLEFTSTALSSNTSKIFVNSVPKIPALRSGYAFTISQWREPRLMWVASY